MAIVFTDYEVKSKLKNRRKLKNFISYQVENKGYSIASVSYIFCSDSYLLCINRDFLGHDTYTDIITFDLSESPKQLEAEIYISVERVEENASKYEVSYQEELHRVIFHGILHLIGYADKNEKEKKEMRNQENKYLEEYKSYIKR